MVARRGLSDLLSAAAARLNMPSKLDEEVDADDDIHLRLGFDISFEFCSCWGSTEIEVIIPRSGDEDDDVDDGGYDVELLPPFLIFKNLF